jgi:hypothetical protein
MQKTEMKIESRTEQKTEMRVIITEEWLKSLPDEEPNDWPDLDDIDDNKISHVNLLNTKSMKVLAKVG